MLVWREKLKKMYFDPSNNNNPYLEQLFLHFHHEKMNDKELCTEIVCRNEE